MRVIGISRQQIGLTAVAGGMIGLIFPFLLYLPSLVPIRTRPEILWIATAVLLAAMFPLIFWLRYRRHRLLLDRDNVRYSIGDQDIWGGPWSAIVEEAVGRRFYYVDGESRRMRRDILRNRFEHDDELMQRLSELPRQSVPKQAGKINRLATVLAIVGIVLLLVCLMPLSESFRESTFELDAKGISLTVGLTVGVLLALIAGFIALCTSPSMQASDEVKASLKKPVEMVLGVRYRYDITEADRTKHASPLVHYVLFGFMAFFCVVFGTFLLLQGRRGDQSMGGLALLLGLSLLPVVIGVARSAQQWRDSAKDEFELTFDNDLLVHRDGQARRVSRTKRPARPWSTNQTWGAWSEEYADVNGMYLLDRRFLEPIDESEPSDPKLESTA